MKKSEDELRFELRHSTGEYLYKRYATMKGGKAAITFFATRYRSFGYRVVDRQTGETWGWDPDAWKLKRMDEQTTEPTG